MHPADLATTTALMLYMHGANLIGFPAISVPVGAVPSTHATAGSQVSHRPQAPPLLPVGLQLMAPCWHEASLLHAGAVLEAAVAEAGAATPLPRILYDPLSEN